MTSAESQEILNELNNVSVKMQQLLERKKVLCIMKELKDRVCYEPTGERQNNEQELNNIDKELEMLEAKRAKLQQRYDNLINGGDLKHAKKVSFSNITLPDLKLSNSSPQVFFVEIPPAYPAPTILDPKNLQFKPCKTRCPECMEFITTNTSTHVSSMTWLACALLAMMGCIAGCCLAPFCMDSFKNTTHKCPKCHSCISTVKKL